MEKYLGNKKVLLSYLFDFVKENCPDSRSICDIFAGTTNVGRFFNGKGFTVYSNDVNRFSFILGRCYFGLTRYPKFENITLPADLVVDMESIRSYLEKTIRRDGGIILDNYNLDVFFEENKASIKILSYLNNIKKYREAGAGYIKDHYTVYGANTSFISMRGTSGKRNYFSKENAEKLDLILEQIREWNLLGLLDEEEISLLLASVIEEVVLVANVNGTFHDFNRDRLWPNSLQSLTLKIPLFEIANNNQFFCNDALESVKIVPANDILYIDPPYNFRQYTAYYHFINFISAYPFIGDLAQYLNEIEFVRGQNMKDDYTSDFCFQDKFIGALKNLISNSRSRYVVMSYYGGRNHWNHWSKEEVPTDNGFKYISSVFEDRSLFGNFKTESLFQKRQNYQSRAGEKKELIDEYLFWGERARTDTEEARPASEPDVSEGISESNRRFNLHFFRQTMGLPERIVDEGSEVNVQ